MKLRPSDDSPAVFADSGSLDSAPPDVQMSRHEAVRTSDRAGEHDHVMAKQSILHTVSRKTVALGRPLAGRRVLPLYGILEHRGRTSGRVYRTPVVVRGAGDAFLIPIPFGEATQWAKNVLAAGEATIVSGGRKVGATEPRVIDRSEAQPAFNRVERWAMRRAGIDRFMWLRRAS